MNPEIKRKVYEIVLSEPAISQKEIAKRLNISESTVSRAINSVDKSTDYQLAIKVAGKFIQEFQKADDFWKLQITKLEQLKQTVEDPIIILKIMREQSDRYEKILFMARQWELVEGLRFINKGMIPLKNKEKELSHNIKKTI